MRKILFNFCFFFAASLSAQQISIHQEESEKYRLAGISASAYDSINQPLAKLRSTRANCTLDKIVYGWHPYWSNGLQVNYDWNLLSHLCYFSYELDAASGQALSTHNFSTAQAVSDALSNGVRVDLCVTLFSNHATFLTNAGAKQTLITNLINLISARGAHGVNIDFEGLPSSQAVNFRNFMNDLSNQMHAAIPGSQVSTVLYSVDWNNALDVANMSAVDYFIIMGYDYYYSGSTTAGPNDPLFHFGSTYNYTLSRSVSYYLNKGVPENKLVLGLPYYGREWPVNSFTVPAAASASGVSRTYTTVRSNASGHYSAANRHYEPASKSTFYNFNNSGMRQCFISETNDLRARMDFINKRGIAGMGIWALGYDDGYNDFWQAIEDHFSDCRTDACTDTLTDIGGGRFKNYYDNEDYTYTIAPDNAISLSLNFSSFSLENNYDFLYVYNGPDASSPQVPGSPFTGSNIPAPITASNGILTLRFTSDGNTTSSGFVATYLCQQDNTAPLTQVNSISGWKTQDFPVSFNDQDAGSGVNERYWVVMDHDGNEWRANAAHGFFNDNFDASLHPDWAIHGGNWGIASSYLVQSDENNGNSNIAASVEQNSQHSYLYHWSANMSGTGNNRRSGLHFFCDDASLPNRGNSYLVYFRVDSDKCQIYEVNNDVLTLITDDDVVLNAATWYDYKITYNPASGTIMAFVNNVLVSQWTDPTPLTNGNSISLRTGNVNTAHNDVKVYRSRGISETVTIGSAADMVRYQNNGTANPSCRVRSIVNDFAYNWSLSTSANANIDWTSPASPLYIYEGETGDIDITSENLSRSANWSTVNDPHSDIAFYQISIGLNAGDSSVHNWTAVSLSGSDTLNGLNLGYGQTYFLNLRAVNGAGLKSAVVSSDGFSVQTPASAAGAGFIGGSISSCSADSLQLQNTSTFATSFQWSMPGLQPSASNAIHPNVAVPSSGNYSVTLIAMGPGGNDTLTQNINITLVDPPLASFTVVDTLLYLPGAFLAISNQSTNANSYWWDFGDSTFSSDSNPWHAYLNEGVYTLWLVAGNGICGEDSSSTTIHVLAANSIEDHDEFEMEIAPNPTPDVIRLKTNGNQHYDVVLMNAIGQTLQHHYVNSDVFEIHLGHSAPGLYFIRISTKGKNVVYRIVKS